MRHLHAIVLASLAAVGGVASTMRATADDKLERHTFSVTSARESALQRGAGRVGSRPTRSFTGTTALPVTRLPRGARPHVRLPDRTGSAIVPLAGTGAIPILRPSVRPSPGTPRVNVLATGGEDAPARELAPAAKPPMALHFSLRLSPAHQIVPQGAAARFTLQLTRTTGFHRRVTLRVLRLPRGATANWTPTELTVTTNASQRLGSDRLVVEATSRVDGRAVRRHAAIVLTVVGAHAPPLGGDLDTPLYPGGGAPLDLVLTNPHHVDIRVTALNVSVGASTTNPRCSGAANYGVTQYSGGYPLVLHPGSTRLSALVANSSAWPQVWMHDLPTNQDACQGAVVSLDYSGLAT
jgi:hypothetical protein